MRAPATTARTRLNLANTTPDIPVLTTEQQFLQFTRTHQRSALKASTPADGTVMLDYPLVNTASDARREKASKAGQVLAEVAGSAEGRKILAREFLRDAQGQPLADGAGVGAVKLLTLKDPEQVDRALRQWQVLAILIRTLVVEDVPGRWSRARDRVRAPTSCAKRRCLG